MRFWDSSALVPLLLTETDTPRRTEEFRADPLVTVWWGTAVECESALQRRLREGGIDPAVVRHARERLKTLSSGWHEVPPSSSLRQLATRLLRTHPLRAADALQLAAALTLVHSGLRELPFVTADIRLAEAADAEGLKVIR